MKRRVLSLVIAGIMSAGLIACGSSDAGTASSEAPAASSAEAPSAQAPEESTEAPASDAEPFIINIGTATVTITGTGNYTGAIEKTFKIYLKGTYTIAGKVNKKCVMDLAGASKKNIPLYKSNGSKAQSRVLTPV